MLAASRKAWRPPCAHGCPSMSSTRVIVASKSMAPDLAEGSSKGDPTPAQASSDRLKLITVRQAADHAADFAHPPSSGGPLDENHHIDRLGDGPVRHTLRHFADQVLEPRHRLPRAV